MLINNLIAPDHVACCDTKSKKRALEILSEIIARDQETVSTNDVFDSLIARERLGGTGVGHGVAIPHGRLKNSTQTYAAFIKLDEGVDYDAPDQQAVDLLFALLVPEESTEEHLQILAQLAQMFSDESFRNSLRDCDSAEQLHTRLISWKNSSPDAMAS